MSTTTPTRDELKGFLRSLPADERLARTEGTYFSNLEDIWDQQATTNIGVHVTAWFQAIVRTPEQGQTLYAESVDQKNLVHPMASTDASSATNKAKEGLVLIYSGIIPQRRLTCSVTPHSATKHLVFARKLLPGK